MKSFTSFVLLGEQYDQNFASNQSICEIFTVVKCIKWTTRCGNRICGTHAVRTGFVRHMRRERDLWSTSGGN